MKRNRNDQNGPVLLPPPVVTVAGAAGRDSELLAVLSAWSNHRDPNRPAVCSVIGSSGVGLSQLAAEQVRRLTAKTGSVTWLSADAPGGLGAELAVRRDGNTGVGPGSTAPGAIAEGPLDALFGSTDRPALVVIDGLDDAAELDRTLPRRSGGWVLVTTSEANAERVRLLGPVVRLGPLDVTGTETLLARTGHKRLVAQAGKLTDAADGRAQIIALLAGVAAIRSKRGDRWAVPGLLLEFGARAAGGGGSDSSLAAAVAMALTEAEKAHPGAAHLAAVLAVCGGGPFPIGWLAGVTSLAVPTIASLAQAGLVISNGGAVQMPRGIVRCLVGGELDRLGVPRAAALASGVTVLAAARDAVLGRAESTVVLPAARIALGLAASSSSTTGVPGELRRAAASLVDTLLGDLPVALMLPLVELAAPMGATSIEDDEQLAQVHLLAGQTAVARGEFAALARRAEAEMGPHHPDTLSARRGEAAALVESGRAGEALALLHGLLDGTTAAGGTDSEAPDAAAIVAASRQLGLSQLAAGQVDAAVETLLEASNTSSVAFGDRHPETLETCRHLAGALAAAGRHREALGMLEEVVEGLAAQLGPNAPTTLLAKRMLGAVLNRLDRPGDAMDLLEQAAQGLEAHFGAGSVEALDAWSELGAAYQAAGRGRHALLLLETVVDIAKDELGPTHPLTLDAVIRLGAAHLGRSDAESAGFLLYDFLPLAEASLGAGHPTVERLHRLAELAAAQQGQPARPAKPAVEAPTSVVPANDVMPAFAARVSPEPAEFDEPALTDPASMPTEVEAFDAPAVADPAEALGAPVAAEVAELPPPPPPPLPPVPAVQHGAVAFEAEAVPPPPPLPAPLPAAAPAPVDDDYETLPAAFRVGLSLTSGLGDSTPTPDRQLSDPPVEEPRVDEAALPWTEDVASMAVGMELPQLDAVEPTWSAEASPLAGLPPVPAPFTAPEVAVARPQTPPAVAPPAFAARVTPGSDVTPEPDGAAVPAGDPLHLPPPPPFARTAAETDELPERLAFGSAAEPVAEPVAQPAMPVTELGSMRAPLADLPAPPVWDAPVGHLPPPAWGAAPHNPAPAPVWDPPADEVPAQRSMWDLPVEEIPATPSTWDLPVAEIPAPPSMWDLPVEDVAAPPPFVPVPDGLADLAPPPVWDAPPGALAAPSPMWDAPAPDVPLPPPFVSQRVETAAPATMVWGSPEADLPAWPTTNEAPPESADLSAVPGTEAVEAPLLPLPPRRYTKAGPPPPPPPPR